jgi:hypothetical protein
MLLEYIGYIKQGEFDIFSKKLSNFSVIVSLLEH